LGIRPVLGGANGDRDLGNLGKIPFEGTPPTGGQ